MSSSIIIGKLISALAQFSGFSATALPGLIVLKLKPNFISDLINQTKLKSIIITGTNGKTTTARLVGDILKKEKIEFIHNRFGSNLIRGIASTLINQISWLGKFKSNWAVWEVDEAALSEACRQLKPIIVLFNNLSRDQLDRYGETDAILKSWQKAINHLPPNSKVLINQTQPNLLQLQHPNRVLFGQPFGFDYQQANFQAAAAIAKNLGLKPTSINQAIKEFRPVFGRGEIVNYQGRRILIILVKNPAGFNAVLNLLTAQNKLAKKLLIILNDKVADGTDVSWIWDIHFNNLSSRLKPIIVSGSRTLDMALRLKYAGLNPNLIIIEPNIYKALKFKPSIILPTYTAMLKLRQIISNQKFN